MCSKFRCDETACVQQAIWWANQQGRSGEMARMLCEPHPGSGAVADAQPGHARPENSGQLSLRSRRGAAAEHVAATGPTNDPECAAGERANKSSSSSSSDSDSSSSSSSGSGSGSGQTKADHVSGRGRRLEQAANVDAASTQLSGPAAAAASSKAGTWQQPAERADSAGDGPAAGATRLSDDEAEEVDAAARLSFAALQWLPLSAEEERLDTVRARLLSMDTFDVVARLHLVTDTVAAQRDSLAAKIALKMAEPR
eukprot:356737-Chlamydomonas_euryale.AAC.2